MDENANPIGLEAIRSALGSAEPESEQPSSDVMADSSPDIDQEAPITPADPELASQEPQAEQPVQPQEEDIGMPAGLSRRGQERFRTLHTEAKEAKAALSEREARLAQLEPEFEQVRNDLEGFRSLLNEHKAEPEELLNSLDYIKKIKTGDIQGAAKILQQQLAMLAPHIGEMPQIDVFSDHPDIREAVDAMQITPGHALELLRGRQERAAMTQQHQRQTNMTQAQQMTEARQQRAASSIEKLARQWGANDPDFGAKEAALVKQADQIKQTYPPEHWAAVLTNMYEAMSSVAPRQPVKQPSALRPSGGSGGSPVPKTTLDALKVALRA